MNKHMISKYMIFIITMLIATHIFGQSTWKNSYRQGNDVIISSTSTGNGDYKRKLSNDLLWLLGAGASAYYGFELWETGYVVLGRDMMAGGPLVWFIRKQMIKYKNSLGTLGQIEVRMTIYNEMGQKTDKLSTGETSEIRFTIENRGIKKVKGIKPNAHLSKSIPILSKTNSLGNKMNGHLLEPGQIMNLSLKVAVPIITSENKIDIFASISKERTGKKNVKIENLQPPDLEIMVDDFLDQDGNQTLDALETGRINVTVKNTGNGPARDIQILSQLSSKRVIVDNNKISVGYLPAGQSRNHSFSISADKRVGNGSVEFILTAVEKNGFEPLPIKVTIPTAEFVPPVIVIRHESINDGYTGLAEGNGNYLIENGEQVEIILNIINQGKGPAYGCEMMAILSPGPFLLKSKIQVGLIAPGGSMQVPIAMIIPIDYRKSSFDLNISLSDERGAVNVQKSFTQECSFSAPALDIDYVLHDGDTPDSKGNQNGMIEPGENIVLEILPLNRGAQLADDVTLSVSIEHDGIFFSNNTNNNRFTSSIGRILAKSQGNSVRIPFRIRASAKPGLFDAKIIMSQSVFPELFKTIELELYQASVQTVAFGNNPQSDFGRFSAGDSDISLNVDVAPDYGQKDNKTIAVIIGNRDYQIKGVPNVDYADRDARVFKAYMARTRGIKDANIIYKENATFAEFMEIFGSQSNYEGILYSRVKKGMNVIVFYSGHGAPDVEEGTGYIVPVDSDPSKIKLTGYPVELMKKNLSKLKSNDVTLIMDACFSGQSSSGDFLIKGISPAMLKLKNPEVVKGVSVFAASEKNQVSSWYPKERHGVYTYYFLAGMKGYADLNNDKEITYGEMNTYLAENIPEKVIELSSGQRKQIPTFIGNDNRVLVKMR
jgi:hypothetical protein